MPPTARLPRVLVVDDEPDVLETTVALLADDNDVVGADDPLQALELARSGDFDVVCSDFRMPRMNGIDLLRTIARESATVTGVLLTAYGEYAAGFEDPSTAGRFYVVIKPYPPQRLIDAVARAVTASRRNQKITDAAAVDASKKT